MATSAQQQAERIKQLEKQYAGIQKQSLSRENKEQLQKQVEIEKKKALETIAKTSVGARREEDFKQKYGVTPKQVLSGVANTVTKTPEKPKVTIPPQQSKPDIITEKKKEQEKILDAPIYVPGGGGVSVPLSEIPPDAKVDEMYIDMKQNALQTKIDTIINDIFKEVNVSDLKLSDRIKIEALPSLIERRDALLALYRQPGIGSDAARMATTYYNQAMNIQSEIDILNAIKIKVDVVVKFEQYIDSETKKLQDWIDAPTFDPTQKEVMIEQVKAISRIIENALVRNVQLKEGLIARLNDLQLKTLEKIKNGEKAEVERIKFLNEQRQQKQKPKITDAEEILGEGRIDESLQSRFDSKTFTEIFTKAFDSSPEKWAKIIVDQARGAEIAQKMLNSTKVSK